MLMGEGGDSNEHAQKSTKNPVNRRGKLVSGRILRKQLFEYHIGHFLTISGSPLAEISILRSPRGAPGFFRSSGRE